VETDAAGLFAFRFEVPLDRVTRRSNALHSSDDRDSWMLNLLFDSVKAYFVAVLFA
jgi:hypothetical protein